MAKGSEDDRARMAEKVMIDIISSVPGFTAPSQARSRETTYAIVVAATDLLQERDYSSIKMQDIAERAGCAVTAIYARFSDKYVLLTAIHLLLLQEARPILDREFQPGKFRRSGLNGLAKAFIKFNEDYFVKNFNFITAGISHNDGEAYRITAYIMDDYALRIAGVIAEITGDDVKDLAPSVKFAIHTILGVYRDWAMGSKHFKRPSVPALSQLFALIIERRLRE